MSELSEYEAEKLQVLRMTTIRELLSEGLSKERKIQLEENLKLLDSYLS